MNIENKIINFLTDENDILLAYHFGSSLLGIGHDESDIDIAILFEKKPNYNSLLEIVDKLTGLLQMEVDLSVLNDASPIFCMQVLSKGKNIYHKDIKIKSYFEIRIANEYDDLQYFRSFQEKNIFKGKLFA